MQKTPPRLVVGNLRDVDLERRPVDQLFQPRDDSIILSLYGMTEPCEDVGVEEELHSSVAAAHPAVLELFFDEWPDLFVVVVIRFHPAGEKVRCLLITLPLFGGTAFHRMNLPGMGDAVVLLAHGPNLLISASRIALFGIGRLSGLLLLFSG
jgi:hypothetical protein